MKKFARLLAGLTLLLVPMLVAVPAQAALFDDAKDQACAGLQLDENGSCTEESGGSGISRVLKTVIGILSLVVGVISVIMIIIGGIKYATSQGDSAGVSSAKNTIIYAVVGLVIAAISQFIVRFVMVRLDEPEPTPTSQTVCPVGQTCRR